MRTGPAEVALVKLSAEQLLGYYDAVHARTVGFLKAVTDEGLDRIVDSRWNPPVTLGVRLVSVIDDCAARGSGGVREGAAQLRSGLPQRRAGVGGACQR